ncbi:MAG: NAD(P)H-dependent oxidoreductase subunit E [Chloroflexi bacterium]|nr:NAD(P)H-dependent oxidoreductase subunit E [Chloroflexota bacterium]
MIARYPSEHKRSAVMPLLYLAQREYGYVTRGAMGEVAELLGLEPTQVASIVGFYSLYYDKPSGKHRIQICTDLPCALRGADRFAEEVCQNLGVKLGETTADGMFTVEAVMCLAACDKAPMFQLQNRDGIAYHENQTVAGILKLVEELISR